VKTRPPANPTPILFHFKPYKPSLAKRLFGKRGITMAYDNINPFYHPQYISTSRGEAEELAWQNRRG
jgi:hypothetical protein